jgi:hypothetical protein
MIMQPSNDVKWFPEKLVTTSQTDKNRNAEHHNQNFHHSANLKCYILKKISSSLSVSFHQSDYITKIIKAVGSH